MCTRRLNAQTTGGVLKDACGTHRYDESDEGADNGVDTELLLRALKKGGSSTFSQPPPLPTAALAGAAAPQGAKKDLKGILSAASQ
jgi:hypothetical protein